MASLKDNLHKIIVELRKIRKLLRNDGNNNLPLESYSEVIDNIIKEKNKNNNSKQLLDALIYRTITNFDIPDNITFIGRCAFYGFNSLTSVTIPDSVTKIGNYAFYKCTNLKSVIIPDTVTSIGKEAFRDCTTLSNVTIPNSVTNISDSAFLNCTGLINVIVGNGFNANGLNLSSSTSMEVETIVAILNALSDRSGELEQYTLTLGETNLNILTGEQQDIARNKNWILI